MSYVAWTIPTGTTNILARTIWGEARGAGAEGMAAVACVIRNRVVDAQERWGLTFDAVCLARYQFSCWNPTDPNREKLLAVTDADPQFATALRLAARVSGTATPSLDDTTEGADSYYAVRSPMPSWTRSMVRTVVIGGQAFFRTPNLLTQARPAAVLAAPWQRKVLAWLTQWTTISGILAIDGAVVLALTHQITWLQAATPLAVGAAGLVVPSGPLRMPVQNLLLTVLTGIVAGHLDAGAVENELVALLAAVRAMRGAAPSPEDPPPGNDPFPTPQEASA